MSASGTGVFLSVYLDHEVIIRYDRGPVQTHFILLMKSLDWKKVVKCLWEICRNSYIGCFHNFLDCLSFQTQTPRSLLSSPLPLRGVLTGVDQGQARVVIML